MIKCTIVDIIYWEYSEKYKGNTFSALIVNSPFILPSKQPGTY